MPVNAARVWFGALLFAACSVPVTRPPCVTTEDCGEGLICFEDGCGDPTRGLAVEIRGGSTSGLFPQDFEVPELGKTQDFQLTGVLTVVGSFQREKTTSVDPTQRTIYTDEVTVKASGESEVLPGVVRSYQAKFAMTDRGTFSMNVGQGRYTVTALPTNPEVPPQSFSNVSVGRDAGATLNFAFASLEGSVSLAGRLIKRKIVSPTPSEEYITETPMDLQAIDPLTQEPLSQRIETSTGRPGTRGDFILVVSPRAKLLSSIELVATPRDSITGPMLPSRRFPLAAPFPSTLTLELGDYGSEIPNVKGTVLGVQGQPLSGATVLVEGKVGGGASFRSRPTTTDEQGNFALNVLKPDDAFSLTIYPRGGIASGVTSTRVKLVSEVGKPATFEPAVVRAQGRIPVSGKVLLPDGSPASMLSVRAVSTSTLTRVLPLEDVDVLTDAEGVYELALDEGEWRLEFTPAELPQTSRLVTVSLLAASDGGAISGQIFAPITLPKGRRLTGVVSSITSSRAVAPLPNAQVRFFRLTTIEGQPAAIPVASGVTNGVGQYTVLLPTR